MYSPSKIMSLVKLAENGQIQPKGNLEDADELIGFSFGLILDERGQLKSSGPVNHALAKFIVGNEILREKNMSLQEEIATAVQQEDRTLSDQIDSLKTIKKPGQTYNTHELIETVKPELLARGVGKLAVIAFRYHLPRAEAEVRKAGFETLLPDLSNVGDFDPISPQYQARSQEDWIKRERIVIPLFAILNRI